jgi:transcriptional antiterminator RfaH
MNSRCNSQPALTKSLEPAWYCLRAKPKREHLAAAHLRTLEGVTVLCPRVRFKRATRQGTVWVTEAMFPTYLFAHFELADMQRKVEYTQDVRGIVKFADQYPTIEEEVLAHLREHVGVQEIKELAYAPSEGDNVTIAAGAFAGLEAVITQVLPAKERVKVLMEFLGRKIEAEVECCRILHESERRAAATSELKAAA